MATGSLRPLIERISAPITPTLNPLEHGDGVRCAQVQRSVGAMDGMAPSAGEIRAIHPRERGRGFALTRVPQDREAGGVSQYDLSIAMSETAILGPENPSGIGTDADDVQKWLDFLEPIG